MTVLTTTRERFGIASGTGRGATGSKVQFATTTPAGAAARTFQVRITNCMTGTAVAMFVNDRTFSAVSMPVGY